MTNDSGCKVEAVISRYDLDDVELQYASVDDHLRARWTGEGPRQAEGYRTLAAWFNKRVLKRAYDRNGRTGSPSRLEHDYDVLTGDDAFQTEELKGELAADGVDVDELLGSFVSWGTIRNHLKNCLEAEKPTSEASTDWELRSVDIATDTVERKVEAAIQSLASKDELEQGNEADVAVQVQLSCPDCHTRVPFEEAIERGFICPVHRE